MRNLCILFIFIVNTVYGIEIPNSLNKKLENSYKKGDFVKGSEIISKIESPTSIWYKKNGDYKDSKNFYMWKIIFMYEKGDKPNVILPEFLYFKKLGGVINTDILREINNKLCNSYLLTFNKKLENFSTNDKDILFMENILVNIFNIDLDTISSEHYKKHKFYNFIKDKNLDIDTFESVKVEQTYDAALAYAKNFKYKGNNVEKIAVALTLPFKNEELKVFVITSFIIYNLKYDYILMRKVEGGFGWGTTEPKEILLYKETVCQGYSNLFNDLCKYSNIKSGLFCSNTHAFNWVLINGKYNILDVTWLDCEYSERFYLLNRTIDKKIVTANICKESSKIEKINYIKKIEKNNKYIYNSTIKRITDIDSLFIDLYSYTEFQYPKDDIKIINYVKNKFGMGINAFDIINNPHYPKPYKNDLSYIFIEHHYPTCFQSYVIAQTKDICKILDIKRMPNEKEFKLLKKLNNYKLEIEMNKMGIL